VRTKDEMLPEARMRKVWRIKTRHKRLIQEMAKTGFCSKSKMPSL
jgi:hypothetical protein